MPVELTQTQKRSLYDCLKEHEGEEDLSVHLIASEAGIPVGETQELLRGVGADCRFCIVSRVGGNWLTLFSPKFWD